MKRSCELCSGLARVICESDEASLCFDCDAKVHGANFLVSRHHRTLLCRRCQGPTPWRADGPRLGPTVSLCHGCRCMDGQDQQGSSRPQIDDDDDDESDDDEDDESEDDDEEEEEEGEEQVVPWALEEETTLPPMASSSSSEEEKGSLKRMRGNPSDLPSSSFSRKF